MGRPSPTAEAAEAGEMAEVGAEAVVELVAVELVGAEAVAQLVGRLEPPGLAAVRAVEVAMAAEPATVTAAVTAGESVVPAVAVRTRAATRSARAAAPHGRHREVSTAPVERPCVFRHPCPARPIRPVA